MVNDILRGIKELEKIKAKVMRTKVRIETVRKNASKTFYCLVGQSKIRKGVKV